MAISPPPLNIQPQGLLDWFQIKNGGQNPQYLSNQLQPTYDLVDWYFSTNAEYAPPAAVVYATGTNVVLSLIPSVNKWRFCVSFSLAYVPAAAADQLYGQFILVNTTTNVGELIFPSQQNGNVGGVSFPGSFNFGASGALPRFRAGCSNFWIPPGLAVMALQAEGTNTLGNATMSVSSRICNLQQ